MNLYQNSSLPQLDNATITMLQDRAASQVLSAAYSLIFLVNVPGNGLSLWLLLFRMFPKTPSVIFMINLTLTDLAVGLVLPLQIIYLQRGYNWPYGPGLCGFLTLLFYTNMYCSVLTMTAISVDRYLGIVWPVRFHQRGRRKMCAVAGCVFMWAIVLATLWPLASADLTYRVESLDITTCFDVLKRDMLPSPRSWAVFLFMLFGVLFFAPFVVMVSCYVAVIRQLVVAGGSRQKAQAVRLALAVLTVFVVCFTPNNVLLLAHAVRRLYYGGSLYAPYKLSLCVSCANSCVDPFIYYFASAEFRRKLRKVLRVEGSISGTESVRTSKASLRPARRPGLPPPENEGDGASVIMLKGESV